MVQQLWCCCAVNIPPECLFTQNEDEIEDVFSPEITSKDAFCVKETLRLLDLHEKNELVGKFGPFFHCFIVKKIWEIESYFWPGSHLFATQFLFVPLKMTFGS